jgi:hypothetical protein
MALPIERSNDAVCAIAGGTPLQSSEPAQANLGLARHLTAKTLPPTGALG